jgi:hypothetical protein
MELTGIEWQFGDKVINRCFYTTIRAKNGNGAPLPESCGEFLVFLLEFMRCEQQYFSVRLGKLEGHINARRPEGNNDNYAATFVHIR